MPALRGLALGNSHLAAIRLSYARSENRSKLFSLDFLASGQGGLADLALDHGDLVPTSPTTAADFLRFGSRNRIPLREYDFFLVVGLGFNIFGLEPIYRENRCFGQQNWQTLDPTRSLVSEAALRRMIRHNIYSGSLSTRVASLLRQGSSKPIFQLSQPRPAGKFMFQKRFPSLRRAITQGDGCVLSAIFEAAATAACVQHYVAQPTETISHGLLTAAAFVKDPPRLTADSTQLIKQAPTDFLHANAAYGAKILHHLERQIYEKVERVSLRPNTN